MAIPMPRPAPVRPIPPAMNSPAYEPQEVPVKKGPAPWRLKVGMFVPWLLAAFVCGLVIQVYLAGYGLQEVGNQGMQYHAAFSGILHLFPLLIVIVGFLGADKWAGIGGLALMVMFELQFFFIYGATDPIVRALHPTNGVLMLLLSLGLLLHRPMWAAKPVAK